MTKELSIVVFGYDINDDVEHYTNLKRNGFLFDTDVFAAKVNGGTTPTSIGIDINPIELFKDQKEEINNSSCAAPRSVTVRGPQLGNVKKVTLHSGGNITITEGGI